MDRSPKVWRKTKPDVHPPAAFNSRVHDRDVCFQTHAPSLVTPVTPVTALMAALVTAPATENYLCHFFLSSLFLQLRCFHSCIYSYLGAFSQHKRPRSASRFQITSLGLGPSITTQARNRSCLVGKTDMERQTSIDSRQTTLCWACAIYRPSLRLILKYFHTITLGALLLGIKVFLALPRSKKTKEKQRKVKKRTTT